MDKKILIAGIFIALIIPFSRDFRDLTYAVMFLDVLAVMPFLLVRFAASRSPINGISTQRAKRPRGIRVRLLKALWVPIVLSWFWGAGMGIANDVDRSNVFRNFFGLLMYLLLPLMCRVRPNQRKLVTALYFAAIFQIVYGIQATMSMMQHLMSLSAIKSLSELRSYYSSGFLVIFPLFTVGLACRVFSRNDLTLDYPPLMQKLSSSALFLFVVIFALVVPAMSKGYMLTTGMFFAVEVCVCLLLFMKRGRTKVEFFIVLLFIVAVLMMIPRHFYETLFYTFSAKEKSNSVRNSQAEYLMREFTLFGAGLGAPLKSGYTRDPTGYGFELTYLNIIHKIGIFSVFLFLSYLLTFWIAIERVVKRKNLYESLFALGLMGYTVVGAGNPVLLSPIAVLLHCCAIYLLVYPSTVACDAKSQSQEIQIAANKECAGFTEEGLSP